MTRVSIAEAYDNKDVLTQIYRLMDQVDGQEIDHVDTASSGNTVTVTLVMKSGSTSSFTFATTAGVTIDTTQNITGKKTLSNADGLDVTHDLRVGSDLEVTDEMSVGGKATFLDDVEMGGAAIEQSGDDTVITPTGVFKAGKAVGVSDDAQTFVTKAFVQDTGGSLSNIAHLNQANVFTSANPLNLQGSYGENMKIRTSRAAGTNYLLQEIYNSSNNYYAQLQLVEEYGGACHLDLSKIDKTTGGVVQTVQIARIE